MKNYNTREHTECDKIKYENEYVLKYGTHVCVEHA